MIRVGIVEDNVSYLKALQALIGSQPNLFTCVYRGKFVGYQCPCERLARCGDT